MSCCINHSIGIQWVYKDFTAKKNQKGKKAKAVVNMSYGSDLRPLTDQLDTVFMSEEVHHHKYFNETIMCKKRQGDTNKTMY